MESFIASLHQIETELKKRWAFPYHWHKKQDNKSDKLSYFIYDFLYFEDLLAVAEKHLAGRQDYETMHAYTLNRWYNYWSAVAVEKILNGFHGFEPHHDQKHPTIDFYLNGVPFDHKSTVFPFKYPESQAFAEQNPTHLIHWLYEAQSQEQRLHHENRLFLVFHDANGFHWKLKAEIILIAETLITYVTDFNMGQLKQVAINDGLVWSDLVWVKK